MTNLTDDLLHLCCSECKTKVSSENINLDICVAKCDHCGSVFRFDTNSIETEDLPNTTRGFLNRIFESEQFIHLSLLGFMVFWNISFIIFSVTCINKGYTALAVILGLVTAIGLFLTYFLVAALFGSTQASPQKIVIKNWDTVLPLFGGRNEIINSLHLRGAFAEQYQLARQDNQRATAYKIRGVNQSGDKIDLVNGLRQKDQAIEIEREIHRFIHRKDI
ncbi:MAG: hypothetical protein ACPG49_06380 [Chitinophagales bacterium]